MDNMKLWQEYAPTSRGVEEYFEDLDLTLDDLRGKKILDIGSGLNEFANELKDQNLDIVSFDAFYALSPTEREELYEEHEGPKREHGPEKLHKLLSRLRPENRSSQLVAGRSEALPFADQSFDLIISHYASPFYAEDGDGVRSFFSELNRVLKTGGEARIFPTHLKGIQGTNNDSERYDARDESLTNLEAGGFHIEQRNSAFILKKV